MANDPFLEEEFRVLTPEAFDFVLNNELKRAVRSQNFLTLLVIEPTPQRPEQKPRADVVREIARLVSREVRETDLLSQTSDTQLSVVLLDSDLANSMQVVDRLVSRLEHYEFQSPVVVEVGAATSPTHGADAETLRRAAENRSIHPRRGDRDTGDTIIVP